MQSFSSLSKRLIFSYLFDWICIIAIAAVGGGWNSITPYHRPFSLVDLSISYPYQTNERIPTWLLITVGLVIPAAVVFLVSLIFLPGPTAAKETPKLRRKLWELNAGWMGLALSLATAFMITQGMKNLFGKPRPDLLSRCQPDLSSVRSSEVDSVAQSFDQLWVLVTSDICQQTDNGILQDGFRSFPSGHASFSWAGLLYLTLFVASKFAIAIPWLPPRPFSTNPAYTSAASPSNLKTHSLLPVHNKQHSGSDLSAAEVSIVPIRNQAAAPPVYVLVLVFVPICSAIYITSTRFTDFRHHGFDLLFGSLIGIVCAWFSFRWYHLPIRQGAGWAWGPRSYQRAWAIGVGVGSYVGTEGWSHRRQNDVGNVGLRANEHRGMTETERNGQTGPREDEAVV